MQQKGAGYHVVWYEDGQHSSRSDSQSASIGHSPSDRSFDSSLSNRSNRIKNKPHHHVLHTARSDTEPYNLRIQAALVGATVVVDSSYSGTTENSVEGSQDGPDRSKQQPGWANADSQVDQERAAASMKPSHQPVVAGGEDEEEEAEPADDEAVFIKEVVRAGNNRDHVLLVEGLMRDSGPPLPEVGRFWSTGVQFHAQEMCKPCHYIHAVSGCKNDQDCGFCHFPHPKLNPRPCKTKRIHYKQFHTMLANVLRKDPERFFRAIQTSAANNPEIRRLMGVWVANHATPKTVTVHHRRSIMSL